MGMPREMVSDVGYAMIVLYFRGDMRAVEAVLTLLDRRYRDGRAGKPGAAVGTRAVARRMEMDESVVRRQFNRFAADLETAIEAAGLPPSVMVREPIGEGSA